MRSSKNRLFWIITGLAVLIGIVFVQQHLAQRRRNRAVRVPVKTGFF